MEVEKRKGALRRRVARAKRSLGFKHGKGREARLEEDTMKMVGSPKE